MGIASNSSAGLLIVCGAVNALLAKVVYQLRAPDCSGTVKPFEKPWLQTALMFVAMALCLPIAWIQTHWAATRNRRNKHAHGADANQQPPAGDVEQGAAATAAASRLAKTAAVSAQLADNNSSSSTSAAGGDNAPAGADGGLRQPLLGAAATDSNNTTDSQGRPTASNTGISGRKLSKMHEALLLCIPTGFDLAATTLMNVGLLYVAASVFQILRGSEMLFAALYAVLFLHRPLNRWHFMGVGLCMAGIGCVGASRMLAGGDSSGGGADQLEQTALAAATLGAGGGGGNTVWQQMWGVEGGGGGDGKLALVGMGLILLSQAIQAGQVTVEDHLMSDLAIQPLLVVGWEGLIGSLVMFGGALPLLQVLPYRDGSGFAEDTVGSWCMIRNSPAIAGALGISTFAVLLYNIFGMYVTEDLGAAARVVLENARTLLVWLAALTLYYTGVGGGAVGEAWDSWSWLQAVGFAVFAGGAFLYNKGHQQQDEEEEAAGKAPTYSKWAVLKSTLSISTGHRVAAGRRFRAAGNAVLAGLRAQRLGNGGDCGVLHRISEASEA